MRTRPRGTPLQLSGAMTEASGHVGRRHRRRGEPKSVSLTSPLPRSLRCRLEIAGRLAFKGPEGRRRASRELTRLVLRNAPRSAEPYRDLRRHELIV